jgi:hypothetical protein
MTLLLSFVVGFRFVSVSLSPTEQPREGFSPFAGAVRVKDGFARFVQD